VHLGRGFRTVEDVSEPDEPLAMVRCGAALLTQRLVYLAARHGWGELEILAGLPGQLGGALTMNAQNIGQFVQGATVVALEGGTRLLRREDMRFSYRYAALAPGIITDVTLSFPKIAPDLAHERIRQILQYRNTTQEVRLPSAGCAFKNPPGIGAGKLIDQAGLKGSRIGDAQVSHRHANFIVNLGQATCDDVLSLMEHIQRRVQRASGILLEPEVRMIGEQWTR
jgi:UDP-N-acetylmuramate dehydrogenase